MNMGIDLYTKVILTVIAVSTSFIAFKDTGLVPSASAGNEKIHKIAICETSTGECADLAATRGYYSLKVYNNGK